MFKTWTYSWLHIPTGMTGTETVDRFSLDCIRFKTLADALQDWNRSPNWKYWA